MVFWRRSQHNLSARRIVHAFIHTYREINRETSFFFCRSVSWARVCEIEVMINKGPGESPFSRLLYRGIFALPRSGGVAYLPITRTHGLVSGERDQPLQPEAGSAIWEERVENRNCRPGHTRRTLAGQRGNEHQIPTVPAYLRNQKLPRG